MNGWLTRAASVGGVMFLAVAVVFGAQPAMADAISNAYNLNGYKIMADLDTIAQARYNEPASYQAARWDGTRWQSQAAYVNDSKAAYIRSLSGYQATGSVSQTSHATQMATQTVNGTTKAGASTVLKTAEVAEAATKARFPVFKAASLVKGAGVVGVVVTGLQAGFELGKGGMQMFGYDYDGAICGTGSDALAEAYGSDCTQDLEFTKAFLDKINQDAQGRPSGFLQYPLGIGCDSSGCYQLFSLTPLPQNKVGDQAFNWAAGTQKPQGSSYVTYWCADAGGTVDKGHGVGFSVFTNSDGKGPTNFDVNTTCGAKQLYAMAVGGSSYEGSNPDTEYHFDPDYMGTRMWFSNLSPNYAEGETSNPPRYLECSVTGSDGKTYTAQTEDYTEGDKKMPSPECPALPEGVTPTHLDLDTVKKDSGQRTPLQQQDATDAYKNAVKQYPECMSGLCTLDLVQVSSDTSCFELKETCIDWFKDSAKDTKYACYYGSHKLALSKCNVYAQVFDPAKRAAGNPYAMPDGSDPGMQSTLQDGQKAFGEPVQDPNNIRSCIDAGVSMNPITWVQYPVQCALQWAFVPRDVKVKESVSKVKGSWDKSALGEVPKTTALVVGIVPTPSGCKGPKVEWDFRPAIDLDKTFYPLNACDNPEKQLASASFWATTAVFIIGGVYAVTRYLGGSVGFVGFGGKGESE